MDSNYLVFLDGTQKGQGSYIFENFTTTFPVYSGTGIDLVARQKKFEANPDMKTPCFFLIALDEQLKVGNDDLKAVISKIREINPSDKMFIISTHPGEATNAQLDRLLATRPPNVILFKDVTPAKVPEITEQIAKKLERKTVQSSGHKLPGDGTLSQRNHHLFPNRYGVNSGPGKKVHNQQFPSSKQSLF